MCYSTAGNSPDQSSIHVCLSHICHNWQCPAVLGRRLKYLWVIWKYLHLHLEQMQNAAECCIMHHLSACQQYKELTTSATFTYKRTIGNLLGWIIHLWKGKLYGFYVFLVSFSSVGWGNCKYLKLITTLLLMSTSCLILNLLNFAVVFMGLITLMEISSV